VHSVRDDGHASHIFVTTGLDPVAHTDVSIAWIAGSSPAMTSLERHARAWAEAATGGEMFEKDEVLKELHGRLVAAGINPLDPKVQAVSEVVNAFYAEKTREVLQKMQDVLSKIET
jgi:hypothetical protein